MAAWRRPAEDMSQNVIYSTRKLLRSRHVDLDRNSWWKMQQEKRGTMGRNYVVVAALWLHMMMVTLR